MDISFSWLQKSIEMFKRNYSGIISVQDCLSFLQKSLFVFYHLSLNSGRRICNFGRNDLFFDTKVSSVLQPFSILFYMSCFKKLIFN